MTRHTHSSHRGSARLIRAAFAGASLALVGSLPLSARAQGTTVLTIDFAPNARVALSAPIPQDYGDNVIAAAMGAYSYGGSAPFTPNVTTLYSGGANGPAFWTTGYGDLTNVAFGEQNQLLLVTLIPAAGNTVTLNSFDLGAFSTDRFINAVQVFGGTGGGASLLFNQNNVLVRGAAGHSAFSFNGISSDSFLTIQIDAVNLGAQSDNIGIDNISFTQTQISASAPEPGTLALLTVGGLSAVGAVIRRRKRLSAP